MSTVMTPILYSLSGVLAECFYEVAPLSCQSVVLAFIVLLNDMMISNIIL